jgi:hypothetical protein
MKDDIHAAVGRSTVCNIFALIAVLASGILKIALRAAQQFCASTLYIPIWL